MYIGLLRWTISLFVIILSADIIAAGEDNAKAARLVVEEFCQSEFNGVRDYRYKVKFRLKRQTEEKKRDSQFKGHVIDWNADPLFVVASYQIVSVQIVSSTHAVATVKYEQLARTVGDGVETRKILPEYRKWDVLKLQLVYDNQQWSILDPPAPRISKEALVAYYEKDLRSFDDKWLAKASEAQLRIYHKMQEDFNALKGLKP